jgi:hypothetical protein
VLDQSHFAAHCNARRARVARQKEEKGEGGKGKEKEKQGNDYRFSSFPLTFSDQPQAARV